MIKGVNKKIIEVNNPDSIYFEKAVFYLRPHILELPEEISRDEISCYIAHIGLETNKKSRMKFILPASAAAIALGAAAFLLI